MYDRARKLLHRGDATVAWTACCGSQLNLRPTVTALDCYSDLMPVGFLNDLRSCIYGERRRAIPLFAKFLGVEVELLVSLLCAFVSNQREMASAINPLAFTKQGFVKDPSVFWWCRFAVTVTETLPL